MPRRLNDQGDNMRTRKAIASISCGDASATRHAGKVLRAQAKRIRLGWLERRSAKRDMPPWDNPNGFVRREAYRLVRHFLNAGCGDVINDMVGTMGKVPRSPTFELNPFHWGLLVIAGDDPSAEFVTRPDRRLFGAQLLHAHRHDVPEALLIGFISQLGGAMTIHQRVAKQRRGKLFDPDTP